MRTEAYGRDDAAERVLRRAEISRLTRNLKSKLAIATIKTQGQSQSQPQLQLQSPARTGHSQQGQSHQGYFRSGSKDQPRPMSGPPLHWGGLEMNEHTPRKRARTLDSRAVLSAPLNASSQQGSRSEPRWPRVNRSIPRHISQGSPLRPVPQPELLAPPEPMMPLGPPPVLSASVGPRNSATQSSRSQFLSPSGHDAPTSPRPEDDNEEEPAERSAEQKHTETNPPSTPPPPNRTPRTPTRTPTRTPRGRGTTEQPTDRDGANLLLYLATSPGRPGPPRTPRTPDFNLNDYLYLYSPSPGRTPSTGGPPSSAATGVTSAPNSNTPKRFSERFGSMGRLNQLNTDLFANMNVNVANRGALGRGMDSP